MPLSEPLAQVFSVSELHASYWKDFCDTCYTRFGFEEDEVRTYEQKYETFCSCKWFVTEEHNYERQLLKTREEDFQRLRTLYDLFTSTRDARELIPIAYALVSLMEVLRKNVLSDLDLIRYICPRHGLFDKASLHLPLDQRLGESLDNDVDYEKFSTPLERSIVDQIDLPQYRNGKNISDVVWTIVRRRLCQFEDSIMSMENLLPENEDCPKGSEMHAFLYRLFMSYEDSLPDIKNDISEFPPPIVLDCLQQQRDTLIEDFVSTPLGRHWKLCMSQVDGIKSFANYFMHHRKEFSEKDEHAFFYTLDKICIIEDLLRKQNAKYGIDLVYPVEWFEPKSEDKKKGSRVRVKPMAEEKPRSKAVFKLNSKKTSENHLRIVYNTLVSRGWISTSSEKDFLCLFSGKSNDCVITWNGRDAKGKIVGVGTLKELFARMIGERLISCTSGEYIAIIESHFKDSSGKYLRNVKGGIKPSKSNNEFVDNVIKMLRANFEELVAKMRDEDYTQVSDSLADEIHEEFDQSIYDKKEWMNEHRP